VANDENKVVVHYIGGKLAKGYAFNFNQDKDMFQLYADRTKTEVIEVSHSELKAVFFVKTFEGNPAYKCPETSEEDVQCVSGMKLRIVFKDGEAMYATTWGYSPARKGFFIAPFDKDDNNKKIYVINSSTSSVQVIR
jgi:hypothetical protein